MEFGDEEMNQESWFTRLLHRVKNEDSDTKPFSPFIYMVPSVLRKVNPSSFDPRLVSIGPLHREDEDVKAFEEQKVSYIIDLMSHMDSPEEVLKSCMTKAYALMNRIKASYIWTKTFTDDAEIAEMMVTDALFILGFLKVYISIDENSLSRKELQFTTIMNDLLLLENQIPLFFLDEMFQCTRSIFTPGRSLLDLIIPLLSVHNLFHEADLKVDNISMGTNDHILSLLHQCYAPPNNNIKKYKNGNRIRSVADLDMAGVSFKPSEDKTWVMGIEVKQYRFSRFYRFWKKTTLTMPVLVVDDSTEFLIRNLIAYEQSFQDQKYVSTYACAMDELINTADDVAKLIDSGVLINDMGSNEEAANIINNLGTNVMYNSYYKGEWVKLNEYCSRWWPKLTASFRRTYLIYPWKFVALIAGIVLFVLQVVQTIRSS